jgi:hypothetical protein
MTTDYPLAMLPHNKELAPWLAQMQGLDLSARRQVLKRFKPTPMPPFLYKYLSSDREFSLQNLHDVLVRSVLRLNSPNSFNDPFEMTAHFVMTATQEEKLARRYLPLVPETLRRLMFGCRAEPAFVDTVMGMLAERHASGYSPVDVYFARQHTKMYRLVVNRRK